MPDQTETLLRIDDLTVRVISVGEGAPIVMLPGWRWDAPSTCRYFDNSLNHAAGWKRYYFDTPGCGKTSGDPSLESADAVVELYCTAIAEKLGDTKFALGGFSYGGYIARGIQRILGDRITGMLLVAPVVLKYGDRTLPERAPAVVDRDFVDGLPASEREQITQFAVVQTKAVWKQLSAFLNYKSESMDEGFLKRLNENNVFSYEEELNQAVFPNPTLIVTGRQDWIVGYEDPLRLLPQYPRSTIAILDAAGHGLFIEQPDAFVHIVHNWLDRVIAHIA